AVRVMFALRRPDLAHRMLLVCGVETCLILYGLAFLYETTGNSDLGAIRDVLANRAPTLALALPMLLLAAGLAVRAGLAPFHVAGLPAGLGASPLGAGPVVGLTAGAAAR